MSSTVPPSPASSPATSSARPWRTAFLAGMGAYLDAGATISTGTVLVLYQSALQLDDATIGMISGLLTFCFAAGAVVGGRLGDRFGRRRVFILTMSLYVVGMAVLTGAAAPAMLYAGVVLVGFAIGADVPVSLALIAEEAPKGKKGRMIGLSGLLWLIGTIVPGILTIVVSHMGAMGARILYGQLLVTAVIVLVFRLGLRESAEWSAAQRRTADLIDAGRSEEIQFAALRQLFAPPVVITVLATGLYYAIWNLDANTFGQFSTFIWVNLSHQSVESLAIFGFVALPISLAGMLIFLRVVDRPARRGWFVFGTVVSVIGFALPLLLGPTAVAIAGTLILSAVGASFSGDLMYKVWTQELVPTLLRSTAQGITLGFARVLAALFAVVTPTLATNNPTVLFSLLLSFSVVAAGIGLYWIPRLPKATELESPVAATPPAGTPV
ncbi:MFS transporter [Nonomuraea terrae]|uniref:MFS transporter n=1 Tax=Nonomuraea terrae TaxID=2530383 RepID=UPI00378F7C92